MPPFRAYAATAILTLGIMIPAIADEPHPTIHHAIAALEQTKDELAAGEHGFGGHRSKAIEHIDAALKELNEALEYADAHPDEVKPGAEPARPNADEHEKEGGQ